MKHDGRIKDIDGLWILRFSYDWQSWYLPYVLDKERLTVIEWDTTFKESKEDEERISYKIMEAFVFNWMETY